jgi:hypothetical protein
MRVPRVTVTSQAPDLRRLSWSDRTRQAIDSVLGADLTADSCGLSADSTALSRRFRRSTGVRRTGWPIGRVLSRRPSRAVGGDHLSTTTVAGRLQRSTRALGRAALRRARAACPKARDFLTLLRVGFAEPFRSPGTLVVSCTTVSPLPHLTLSGAVWRSAFCGTVPRVTPGGCYPPPCPVEPGPSSGSLLHAVARPAHPQPKDTGGPGVRTIQASRVTSTCTDIDDVAAPE